MPKILSVNIIGAGRLGKNIAAALQLTKLVKLNSIFNRNFTSSTQIIKQLNVGSAVDALHKLPHADLTFITTPDDVIADIASKLSKKNILKFASTVVHCSGVLSSEVLSSVRKQNCHIASIHPLKAFRADSISAEAFNDCDCILEGDEAALSILSYLFTPLKARLNIVTNFSKPLYHAGTVIASNYLITLAQTATQLLADAGIRQDIAQNMITRLMQSSLENLASVRVSPDESGEQHLARGFPLPHGHGSDSSDEMMTATTKSFTHALTGPIIRGDSHTIIQHLEALKTNPTAKSLYKSAGLSTLSFLDLNSESHKVISQLLSA